MTTFRNQTIDIARGLGIVAVVLGHNWFALHAPTDLFRWIFAFHMPLFFFLSGVFMSSEGPLWRTVAHKADALLKPYAVVMACVVVAALWSKAGAAPLADGAVQSAIGAAAFAHGGEIAWPWTPMWFLPCLFVTVCVTAALLRLTQSRLVLGLGILLALTVGVPLLADSGLPWSADLLPLSLALCLLGYLLRRQVASVAWRPLYLMAAVAAFFAVDALFANRLDMNARQFGDLPVALLQAGLGIYAVLVLASGCARLTWARQVLSFIGARAMFVLIFHIAFQDPAFDAGMQLFGQPEAAALCALAGGVGLPLLVWQLALRSQVLSAALLPMRPRAARQPPPVRPSPAPVARAVSATAAAPRGVGARSGRAESAK